MEGCVSTRHSDITIKIANFVYSFTIVGPEYIAMMAGEASHPRKNLKRAFKTIYLRFGLFFIGGALACGIVIPYNDENLINALGDASASGTAAASPYVIAMQNLGIGVLPHLTNALLVTSIFSAGNSYVYASSDRLSQGRTKLTFTVTVLHAHYTVCLLMVMLPSSSASVQRRVCRFGASASL